MKQETKELIDGLKISLKELAHDYDGLHWLNCKGGDCIFLNTHIPWEELILKGEYNGCLSVDPESNYNKLMALFDRMEEMERTLATGGLVKDNKGNWLASGTRVKYIQHNADGDWHTGTVDFDVTNLCWYLNTDSGDCLYLAKDYYEVDTFEKFDD